MTEGLSSLKPYLRTEVRTELENAYIAELMAGGQPTKRVINVCSLTGMGKTWLGYMMFAQTPLPPEAMALWISFEQTDEKPLPNISFDTPDSAPISVSNNDLHTQLVNQPFAQRINISALNEVAHSFGDRFLLQYRLGSSSKKDGPLLIFFDGLNELSRKDFEPSDSMVSRWEYTEAQIIEPAARQKNTVIFCFSHAELRWDLYYLREVSELYPLGTMSRDEVDQLLDIQGLSESIYKKYVYEISRGHPWMIRYLLLDEPGLLIKPDVITTLHQKINKLHPVYRDLLYIVGILRVVDVAPIEALLKGLNITQVQGRPVSRPLIRAALGAFANFFEPLSNGQLSRFSVTFRRVIEKQITDETLIERFKIISEYYHQCIHSAYSISERYSALREFFYIQIKLGLIGMSQHEGANFRQLIDGIITSVMQNLTEIRGYLNKKFGSDITNLQLLEYSGVLHDPEINIILTLLSLYINPDGQIVLLSAHKPRYDGFYDRQINEIAAVFLPRIIEPYGLSIEDIEPLAWIAQQEGEEEQPITLDLLRKAHRELRRPEPKSSLLRYHLSRYTAANIVSYNYDDNNYTLNDWLRDLLANYEEQLHGTREII